MNIFIEKVKNITFVSEFLDFNGYPYETVNLYNETLDTFGRYTLPYEVVSNTNCLLIITAASLNQLLGWDTSNRLFVNFLNAGNQCWVWNNLDGLSNLLQLSEPLLLLDDKIPYSSVSWFMDGLPSSTQRVCALKNIKIKICPMSSFLAQVPQIPGAKITKTNPKKDFLLTTIKKKNRPHRDILWKQLTQRPELVDRGHCVYRNATDAWVGNTAAQHSWSDGNPSMDLYNNVWIELVPETLYKGGYYPTEKISKPIGTKTPFLIIATCGYLDYIRSLGFKTFDSIIDEKYDLEYKIENRIKLMLDQLQDIVDNGAGEFYQACKPILDYNHNRLAEISGLWQYNMDLFIQQCLDDAGQG